MDSSKKLAFLFLLSLFFYLNMVSCTKPQFEYSVHCNSIVHEAKPGDEEFHVSPFSERQHGYYSGGDKIMIPSSDPYSRAKSKVVVFESHRIYTTDSEDVFKVEGSLIFQFSFLYEQSFSPAFSSTVYSSGDSSKRGTLDLDFQGFWSRKSGKICMVGSSYIYSKDGKSLPLAAVVKFNNLRDSSNITTLVTGTLDSFYGDDEENYFDQISLLMFPQVGYKYTRVSKEFNQGCSGVSDFLDKSSLGLLRSRTICDMLSGGGNAFQLEYASDCRASKSCHPFGDEIGYLPKFMSLGMIQCSEDKQSLRFHIAFLNDRYMSYYRYGFNTSLVGEGSWDAKKNRLCVVACRILNASSSLDKSHVGDCTIKLSFRFPAVLSIKNPNYITGEIWSDKPRNQPGFFDKILFHKGEHGSGGIQLQGLKYEYTKSEQVEKSCSMKLPTRNNRAQRDQYPDGYSKDMSFHMSFIKGTTNERIGWGSAYALAVGDKLNQRFPSLVPSSSSSRIESSSNTSLLRISYIIKFKGKSSNNESEEIQISAEGVYDSETGNLCMIGCKHLIDSMDCEILVKFQFSPLNSDKRRGNIKGSIESMRESSDSLHFEPLQISGRANYASWATESIPRMNFEMIMSVISNTLAILFVAFQIFHVRKHRGVAPLVSLLMLVIIALGHLTPLVLNLEAMFNQDSTRSTLRRSGKWLEMNEVIIRVVTMVAFLLEIRLLILSWNARCSSTEKQKQLWTAEKRGLYVCVPIYLFGAAIAFLVKWRQNMLGNGITRHSSYSTDVLNSILEGSRAYAGLMLDAFLFPQVIFNMFHNSKEEALSRSFYIGITLIRVLPHGYDLYRAHSYVDIDDSYIYANPTSNYYSTAWDIIIPVLALLFARTIHLQQKFGGRFFLPNRYQESGKHKQLLMASED